MAPYDSPRLIADIGGTYARFALETAQGQFSAQASLLCAEHADFHAAVRFLSEQTRLYKSEPLLWRMLARAHGGLGESGLAHRASAEEYALAGAWLAAIEQLRLAQRGGGLDFFAASQVDARLRDLQAEYARERKDDQARSGR